MTISTSILKRFVDTTLSAEALGDVLRFSSSEVDRIIDHQARLLGLIVGTIITAERHPNADRLQVCTVDCGEPEPRQIICGASNARVGLSTVVALPGTVLHPVHGDAFTINAATIRGSASNGMLCAYQEIGLPFKGSGIIELESGQPGTAAATALGITGSSIELEITPNRPDLLSYQGVAREVAAVCALPLLPLYSIDISRLELPPFSGSTRFMSVQVSGITVTDSPLWLQRELWESGLSSVNSIVDLANLSMLETGQPLHTYDSELLSGALSLRQGRMSEQLVCLDGKTRTILPEDLVVCDKDNTVISLAGIMGGDGTKVTEATTSLIVESGCFPGAMVRQTSRRLGLRSEASLRSEKGLPPYFAELGLTRFLWRIKELFPDAGIDEVIDRVGKREPQVPIHTRSMDINALLGTSFTAEECAEPLKRLGCEVADCRGQEGLVIIPPAWRTDLHLPQDVAEEVIRVKGYDSLPSTLPGGVLTNPKQDSVYAINGELCRKMAQAGYQQTIHVSFTSKQALERCQILLTGCQQVLLPLSNETEYLVPSHLVAFLNNITTTNRATKELSLFECGTVFSAPNKEQQRLSAISIGPELEHTYRKMLGAIEKALGVGIAAANQGPPPYFDPSRSTALTRGSTHLGWIGALNPDVLQAWGCDSDPVFSETDLNTVLAKATTHIRYNPSLLETFTRDITLPQPGPAGDVVSRIKNAFAKESLVKIELLGQYSSNDSETITFRLTFTGEQEPADRILATLTR